jgi:hypothetical protein
MATNDNSKIYPGSVDRYRELRAAREQTQASFGQLEGSLSGEAQSVLTALSVAEELAGLAYILDGIRYSARSNR